MKKNTPEISNKEKFVTYFDVLNIIACLAVQQKLVVENKLTGGMCLLLGGTNISDVVWGNADELQRKVFDTDFFQKKIYSYCDTVALLEYYYFNMEGFDGTDYFGVI